jgi:hypothetical protein
MDDLLERRANVTRRLAILAIGVVALGTLAVHIATNGRYGFFRDELYFLMCGQRLAWGYVDQPPFVALMARLGTALFDHSLVGLRMIPAFASAGLVLLTGIFVLRLGGEVAAALLATVAVATAPVLAVGGHLFTMNAFEPLLWTALALTVSALLQREGRSWPAWIGVGVLLGIGLLNKYSVVFWAVGLLAGLLLTRAGRAAFRWRGFLVAAGLAALLTLPNLWWQARHGFPMLELLRNAQLGKNTPFQPVRFLVEQLFQCGPLAAPLWGLGVVATFLSTGRWYAGLGVAYLVTLVVMFLGHAKGYYLAPAYPTLLAFGAVEFETRVRAPVLRFGGPALLLATHAAILPLVVPVLPIDDFIRYQARLGIQPTRDERHEFNALPQHFADQFGWPGLVEAVSRISEQQLRPEERAQAAIYTQNYGEAAALEFLGAGRNLPTVVSGHNQYFLWGIRGSSLDPLIVIGGSVKGLSEDYRSVVEAGRTPSDPYAMPYETNRPIHLCRGRKTDPVRAWPEERHYQ